MKTQLITASMLYNLSYCPHRLYLDLYGDQKQKDPASPFVQLLWERGALHEHDVIGQADLEYTDLSCFSGHAKQEATLLAMIRGDSLIYSGRIQVDDLLGIPDLLKKSENGNGYLAGDIKSGAALEHGPDPEGRPKEYYAVQLALYTDILERLHLSAGRKPFIWDVHGNQVTYELDNAQGNKDKKTWWNLYEETLTSARKIINRTSATRPAASVNCKNCEWFSHCMRDLHQSGDLTLIPRLGRSKRDCISSLIPSIQHMAQVRPESYIDGSKTVFKGIGADTLSVFFERARLLVNPEAKPYLKSAVRFPDADRELFYDVETDPFEDICYLHGFVERECETGKERYIAFMADSATLDAEEKAFREAWQWITESLPCPLYIYSKYERTTLRKLASKYPDVASQEDIEALFTDENTIDLYEIVEKQTEWPTTDHSIKTLATFLGFHWRDAHPSGAASIEWYHRWLKSGAKKVKERILNYNEDDCRAMLVLLEGIKKLG
jgi:predicted RecB family nuclease